MAIMGLRINGQGGGGGGAGIDDLLAKAFFGDPEIAIKEARLRSDLQAQEYQNRQTIAATQYSEALRQAAQEKALRDQGVYDALAATGPIRGQDIMAAQALGDAAAPSEPPVPVDLSFAAPDRVDPTAVAPVAIDADAVPTTALPQPPLDFQTMTTQSANPLEFTAAAGAEPVPVDLTSVAADAVPQNWLPRPDATINRAQDILRPGEVVDNGDDTVSVGNKDGTATRYTREQADRLGLAAAFSNDPAGQTMREEGNAALLYNQNLTLTPTERAATLAAGGSALGKDSAASRPANESVTLKQELEMRKQIEGLDAYKKLSAVVPVYLSMAKTAGGPLDNAAVMDLVYGLATAEDPGSVVREADSLQVKRIGGLSGEVQALVGYVTGDKPITPEVVAQIMRIAKNRVGSYKQAYDHQAASYADIAKRNGYDVRNAVPTFPELTDFKPQLPPGVTEARVQKYAADHGLPLEQARQILLSRTGGGQ